MSRARPPIEATGPGSTRIRLKVVPGASQTALAGIWGDRLRIRISAPPAGGRANEAVVAYLAGRLGVRPAAVRVVRGAGSPLKTVEVEGVEPAAARRALTGP